jgi:hypothetical protein
MTTLSLPVPLGDAADRITILEIKKERIRDAKKHANVIAELERVATPFFAAVARGPKFDALFGELKEINEALWQIEDDIRVCEARGDFGPEFIRLARAVYITNDERARVKRAINELLGSDLIEEKSYADRAPRREG